MNRIKTIFFVAVLCLTQTVFATSLPKSFSISDRFTETEVEQQVLQLSQHLDIQYNAEIKGIINTYLSKGRKNSELILSRSNYYFPLMENLIAKHNLPEELKYLSVIESGLRPAVRSKAGAVGLWQFMSSTAKMYDLKIHKSHDERKDVARSTEAALLYLNDLYERFDDWSLALAAYNCGPGNINKAIRRSGGKKTYWEIRKYLPRETRRYLPKMIATMYVMNYFAEYGLNDSNYEFSDHNAFGLAVIHEKTSLKEISNLSGLSVSEIKRFNPSYAYSYIPSSKRGNNLIMPEVHLLTYLQNTEKLHLLSEVFYSKNTLFTLPAVDPTEALVEAVKVDVEFSEIHVLDLENLQVEQPQLGLSVNPIAIANVPVQYELYRLRKRETLQSYITEHKIDTNTISAVVNKQGVVRLYRK